MAHILKIVYMECHINTLLCYNIVKPTSVIGYFVSWRMSMAIPQQCLAIEMSQLFQELRADDAIDKRIDDRVHN